MLPELFISLLGFSIPGHSFCTDALSAGPDDQKSTNLTSAVVALRTVDPHECGELEKSRLRVDNEIHSWRLGGGKVLCKSILRVEVVQVLMSRSLVGSHAFGLAVWALLLCVLFLETGAPQLGARLRGSGEHTVDGNVFSKRLLSRGART